MTEGMERRGGEAGTNYRSSVFLSASRITHTIVGRSADSLISGREGERERERAPLFEVTTDGMGMDHGRKDRGGRQLAGCRHSVSQRNLTSLPLLERHP